MSRITLFVACTLFAAAAAAFGPALPWRSFADDPSSVPLAEDDVAASDPGPGLLRDGDGLRLFARGTCAAQPNRALQRDIASQRARVALARDLDVLARRLADDCLDAPDAPTADAPRVLATALVDARVSSTRRRADGGLVATVSVPAQALFDACAAEFVAHGLRGAEASLARERLLARRTTWLADPAAFALWLADTP
ncbi:MAG: hypothetical protein H6825_16755 [Planctomycetes bacterium]|nr:hypothetical protein [Planctomycetota bacterium]